MNRKKLLTILVVLVALGVLGFWWHGRSGTKPHTAADSTYTPTAKNPPVATESVAALNYAFTPADITVKEGSTVTWTNKDQIAYTVTEDDTKSGGPAGSVMPPGQTYQFTFKKAGLFHYHNSLDPNMTGTVTVTAR